MTEEEAKTKWCHHARTLNGNQGNGEACAAATNREGPEANLNCIGAACMAWRWDEKAFDEWQDWRENHAASLGLPDGSKIEEKTLAEFGFCGLAGRP